MRGSRLSIVIILRIGRSGHEEELKISLKKIFSRKKREDSIEKRKKVKMSYFLT
jgi:hypothetical protein